MRNNHKNSTHQKLANKNAAMALRQRQIVPVLAIRRYLRTFKDSYSFLTQLESALGISNLDYKNLRRAIIAGSVMGSLAIEGFSIERFNKLTKNEIEDRFSRFIDITSFKTTGIT